MNKTKAVRDGTLPNYLSVDKQLVVDSLQYLFTNLSSETMNQLVELIGYAGVLNKGLCKYNIVDMRTASQVSDQQGQQQH